MLTRRAFSFSDAITLTSKRCQHGILVVHLTVLLSLFPTLLAWLAWRSHPNLAPPPPLSGIRRQLLYCGLSANALCAITCALVWLVTFTAAVNEVFGLVRLYSLFWQAAWPFSHAE